MNKVSIKIKNEIEKYEKIKGNIALQILNLSKILSSEELNKRRFYKSLPVLDKYLSDLENIESKINKKGIINKVNTLINQNNLFDEIECCKIKNKFILNKLELCNNCICLKCEETCPFGINGCNRCNLETKILACDKNRYRIYKKEAVIDLINDETGELEQFKELGILEDLKLNKKYIYLYKKIPCYINDELTEKIDEVILGYENKFNNDEFSCIDSEEEISRIAQIFLNLDVLLEYDE